MTTYVFLGPSLPRAEARGILDAVYLPPAACGDVRALFERREQPSTIAIVDGYFGTRPAVFHKEILYAIHEGVPVYGSSSMGALRAAELCELGMIGVGEVFEAYAAGHISDDDEVAIVHGSEEEQYAPRSDAMVSIRVGLERAATRGIVSAGTRDQLIQLAKQTFYPERSWRRLLADGAERGLARDELTRLRDWVATEKPDIKREDAIRLLGRLASQPPSPRARAPFTLARSRWLERLEAHAVRIARFGVSPGSGANTEALALKMRVVAGPDVPLLEQALVVHLVERAATRTGIVVPDHDVDAWVEGQGLEPTVAARAAARHRLLLERLTGPTSPVRDALLGHVPTAAVARGSHGPRDGVPIARVAETPAFPADEAELVAWYATRSRRPDLDLAALSKIFRASPSEVVAALAWARVTLDEPPSGKETSTDAHR